MTSMSSLTDQLPDRDELLRMIGLQARQDSSSSSLLSTIAIFAAGLAIGAGVAYFLTDEMSSNGHATDEEDTGAAASS
jgi:hypothetical protein